MKLLKSKRYEIVSCLLLLSNTTLTNSELKLEVSSWSSVSYYTVDFFRKSNCILNEIGGISHDIRCDHAIVRTIKV